MVPGARRGAAARSRLGDTTDGAVLVVPTFWLLSDATHAGTLADPALATSLGNVWSDGFGGWTEGPVLTAIVLPQPPASPADLQGTALRLDADSDPSTTVGKVNGQIFPLQAGATHRLAHDEEQLAAMLRAAYGWPDPPVGKPESGPAAPLRLCAVG